MGGYPSQPAPEPRPELSARVQADPNLTQFWAQMRHAGCFRLDALHRWSTAHQSASPFGRAQTPADALCRPAGDAVRP
jgi:hypothetical protein